MGDRDKDKVLEVWGMIIIKGLSLPNDHMELVIYSNGEVAVFDREAGAFQEIDAKAVELFGKKERRER